jgi:hypothetical protein
VALLVASKAAVCVAVAVFLARALFGSPPVRVRPVLALVAGFCGVVAFPLGVVVAAEGRATAAFFVLGGTVGALSLAVWAARGPGDDGSEDGEKPPESAIDWRAFDRERARWERVRRV